MSGTGKSSVVAELRSRGHKAIDTDWNPDYEEPDPELGGPGWVWREERIKALLDEEDAPALFVSACVPNQSKFYSRFDHVVLLTASEESTLQRLAGRTNNTYGRRPGEMEQVLGFKRTIEPRLRRDATLVIDTEASLEEVVDQVIGLVEAN